MIDEIADSIEVTDVAGFVSGYETEESATSLFNANGNIMVQLTVRNGTVVGGCLTITRDDIRESLEGHTLKAYDCRVEEMNPDALVCDLHPREDALTVRFDDRSEHVSRNAKSLVSVVRLLDSLLKHAK